jgi:hypothetical protein
MAGVDPSAVTAALPVELTDKDWQKKKGLIGKTVKTGLGAELQKIEALHKKIDGLKLDPASNPSKTIEELTQRVKDAKAEFNASIEPLRKQLLATVKVADDAEKALKKVMGGGSAAKAAAAVSKAASDFAVTCKSIDLEARIQKVMADIKKKNDLAKKLLAGSLTAFVNDTKVFLGEPTKENWESKVKQQGRSVSNSVAQLDGYRQNFWSDFEKFKGFDSGTLKLSTPEDFSDKGVKLVKLALIQVKAIASFKP